MTKQRLFLAALVSAVALVACGGDGDDTPPPTPTPIGDRIEPLDTATLQRQLVKKAPAATSRLPVDARVAQVALGALATAKQRGSRGKGVALKIGQGRAVPAAAAPDDLTRLLRWYRLADGTSIAAVTFVAEGARAVRLGVLARRVPDGTVLRFYGADGSRVVEMTSGQLTHLRDMNTAAGVPRDAADMVWGPDTQGPASTLEVQLPAGVAPADLQLAVPQLSHLVRTVGEAAAQAKDAAEIGAAGSCNLDVMCSPELDAESRAVAKMIFTRDGSTFLCTGTLLNDVESSQTPFFLTAAHCISSQAGASTLMTYWFFRANACGGSPALDEHVARLTGGARLLVTDDGEDATLLQLNDALPAGVVYAGSYFGSSVRPGGDVTGIHNPMGDLQKASFGTIRGYYNCPGNGACTSTDEQDGTMFQVKWDHGTTEGGSSGSAIFAQFGNTRYVVGTLHGGNASCQNPSGSDFYGRFERSFAAGIGDWLAP